MDIRLSKESGDSKESGSFKESGFFKESASFKKNGSFKSSNKNRELQKSRKHTKNSMAVQLRFQYMISCIGFAAGLCVISVLAWTVCVSRIWYGNETLYPVLTWVKAHTLFAFTAACLVASIVLACYFLSRPFRYLDAVIHAAELLAHPSEEPIELPVPVRSIEDELNLVREQALRNALIAKEAEQRKNDLIVYLAHDLKTPLTSVIGYLTLLKDEPQISEQMRERYTTIALDKAQRLEDLINEFFDITRFNLTTLTLDPETVNLSRMLEQIVSEFVPVLAEKQLHWKTEIEPGIMLLCDADKLQRVFDNLIRNAVSYSYAKTEVFLSMKRNGQGSRVVVQVHNHGRTIPPEKLSHIFEQFFRVDASRASATGGAGLGLAIAKEIVELHRGEIRAESAEECVAFTVELPCV